MAQASLGIVTVPTPGVPVRITINQGNPNGHLACQSVLIQALSNASHTNTGRVYILDGFKRRVATLAIPTDNSVPAFSATIPNATAALNAADYWVDADIANDGVDASYLVP